MISHDRSSNVDSFCLPFECDLMEFLDLFLKRPLPIICTSIVLFLEIDMIPIPEFFSLIVFPSKTYFVPTEFLKPIFYHTCELPIWILRKLLLNGPIIIEQIVTSTYTYNESWKVIKSLISLVKKHSLSLIELFLITLIFEEPFWWCVLMHASNFLQFDNWGVPSSWSTVPCRFVVVLVAGPPSLQKSILGPKIAINIIFQKIKDNVLY